MDLPPETSVPPLGLSKEVDTPDKKMRTVSKKTVHQHKWMASHLTFSNKLYVLNSNFTSGEAGSGRDRYYRAEVGMNSSVWRINSNCETQYIQGGRVVPGKPEDQKYYQG